MELAERLAFEHEYGAEQRVCSGQVSGFADHDREIVRVVGRGGIVLGFHLEMQKQCALQRRRRLGELSESAEQPAAMFKPLSLLTEVAISGPGHQRLRLAEHGVSRAVVTDVLIACGE